MDFFKKIEQKIKKMTDFVFEHYILFILIIIPYSIFFQYFLPFSITIVVAFFVTTSIEKKINDLWWLGIRLFFYWWAVVGIIILISLIIHSVIYLPVIILKSTLAPEIRFFSPRYNFDDFDNWFINGAMIGLSLGLAYAWIKELFYYVKDFSKYSIYVSDIVRIITKFIFVILYFCVTIYLFNNPIKGSYKRFQYNFPKIEIPKF